MASNIKRQILKDRTFPTSEQISRYQDFNRLNSDFTMVKKLMLQKIALWSGAAITVSAVATVLYLNKVNSVQPGKNDSVREMHKTESYVQPPIPGKQKPFSVFKVSATNGGAFQYETGSVIKIPANAFINEKGNPVHDSIDINYREFHDALDIFLSGIPMKYDSAGTSYQLESAGMLEILAFDNGEKLALKKNTPIEIILASSSDESKYNVYALDTINHDWVYKGKDKILPDEIKYVQTKQPVIPVTQQLEDEELIKPVHSDLKKYSFRILYDKKIFPELSAYDNVLFEVADNNFKPQYYKINWDKISLSAGDGRGLYTVKLRKMDTTINVTAKPVFEEADYAKALATFEAKQKQQSETTQQKEQSEKSKLEKTNKGLSTYNQTMKRGEIMVGKFKEGVAYRQNNEAKKTVMGTVLLTASRALSVFTLGIINSDVCVAYPPQVPVTPAVQYALDLRKNAGGSNQPTNNTIFIVEKGKNTVLRFTKDEPLKYNPKAQNLIWTMTAKNEIAFFQNANVSSPAVVEKDQELALQKIRKFIE